MEIGTLWFGADIDLTKLQQKIQSGNQSILDALKMNYDPQSYNQMVNKLKAQLDNEIFKIRISTDTSAVRQNLQNTLNGIGNGVTVPNINLGQLKGIPKMTSDLADFKESLFTMSRSVKTLKQEWIDMRKAYGSQSQQARAAFKQYNDANKALQTMQFQYATMQKLRTQSVVAQQQLNKEQREAAKIAKQWNHDSLRLNTTLAGGVHISTQLGSALSTLFALDYARQFLNNVIEIGGQLEKQRISIGAILGDTVKATHLFEQIKGLALKSPFGVVELDQYTKQLSAYGFKYNELFDMTKRLADISAGAGTDIGRLTLALGHVRSATYLTGITLRQFSMNNIPMLKMLSDYYTEVENKAVSTAEVQKRISKRQVSYEDVIEQIRRLTDEGGMFYNMQEKISESLAAKFKNLRDAMDIMYGEMAESFVGDGLKRLAEQLLKLTRHWKEIAWTLGVAGAAFVASKLYIGANTMVMKGNTAQTIKQIMATKQLEANNLRAAATYRTLTQLEQAKILSAGRLTAQDITLALATDKLTKDELLNAIALKKVQEAEIQTLVTTKVLTQAEVDAALAAGVWETRLASVQMRLKNMFSGIGMGTWASLALMVGTYLAVGYNEWSDKIEDKAKEMSDVIKSRVLDIQKMEKKIEKKPQDDPTLKSRIEDMKQVLANSEAYTKTLDEQVSKAGSLSEQYDILAKATDNALIKNKQMLDYQEQAASMIKASSLGNAEGVFTGHGFWDFPLLDYFFDDDIAQNIKQTLDSYKDLRTVIDNAWEYKEAIKGVIEEMINSKEISETFAEQLKNAPFEEQIRLLAESGYWDKIVERIVNTDVNFINFADNIKKASDGVTEKWEEITNNDVPKMMKKAAKDRGLEEKEFNTWCLNNVDDFKMMLESIADQLDIKAPEIRRKLKNVFYDYARLALLAEQMNGNEGLAAGALAGASLFTDERLKKLLDEDENADIKDENKTDPSKNGKKDKRLEAAKTKLAEYKAFLSEYKKYREHYDKESAINILEGLFPNLKGKGYEIVDNYITLLDELKLATDENTEARKKFNNEIDKTKADTSLEEKKRQLKENADAMKEYYTKMEEQWKNYRSLLDKSGGNREIAQMAFNEKGRIWDETAKNMLEMFKQKVSELGVNLSMDFNWNMNEKQLKGELTDSKGVIQTELVDLAQEIQKVTRGNFTKFVEDTAVAYKKSLTEAQKLTELEQQRTDLVKQRNAANSEEDKKKYDIQIAAKEKEIANQTWAAFKETEEWGRIFANLDNISTTTLENMLQKLREIVPQLQISEEATKQVYEAMDKMQAKLAERSPFKFMADSLSNASKIRAALKVASSDKTGSILANSELARILKVKVGSKVTKSQLQDALQAENAKIPEGLRGLGEKFKALQDVLSPVIDLFDQLGVTELSDFFNIGNNALSAAAQTASGLSALGLGNLGPYGAAAAAGLSIISSLFAMHDAALQKEIEASEHRQKLLENLTKNIEKLLERTLGGVYNTEATSEMRDQLHREIAYDQEAAKAALDGLRASSQKFAGGLLDDMVIAAEKYQKKLEEINRTVFKEYISEETINAVLEAEKTATYYDTAYASLLAQRDELKHQMDMEKDKKKSDQNAIDDYKQQLQEMDDEIKHFAEDMAKSLYDIDVKSWASELGDALFEAWQKGESGAEAFKKKASEIMAEVAKNIAVAKLIETAMQPVLDAIISEMERTSGRLDAQSVEKIAGDMAEVSTTLPESFNTLMDALNEGMKKAGLTDMKELANETKSATQNGIGKEITEQDTTLWASYLNAIRLDVSVIRATEALHLPVISTDVHRVSILAETQVAHLQQIAENTKRNADAADKIYDAMHRIETGATKLVIK